MTEITKEDFQKYEGVRRSGVTNMFNIGNVVELSNLTEGQVMEIIENYDEYVKEYPDVRE